MNRTQEKAKIEDLFREYPTVNRKQLTEIVRKVLAVQKKSVDAVQAETKAYLRKSLKKLERFPLKNKEEITNLRRYIGGMK